MIGKFFQICAWRMQGIVHCGEWKCKHVLIFFSFARMVSFLPSFGNDMFDFFLPDRFDLQHTGRFQLGLLSLNAGSWLFCTSWRVEYIFDNPYSSSNCCVCNWFAFSFAICSLSLSSDINLSLWYLPPVWGHCERPPISENTHGQNVMVGAAVEIDEVKWFSRLIWHKSQAALGQ